MIQDKIKKLYELSKNNNFLCDWEIKENTDNLNDSQINQANSILEKHHLFILVSNKICDVYSFCFFIMSQLSERLILNAWSDSEKQYYNLCYDILKEANFID